MKRATLLLALAACDPQAGSAPAPMKCADCTPLCSPMAAVSCEPIHYLQSGRIAYVKCKCGAPEVESGDALSKGRGGR